ncbi:coiled-coil domain-containing protein 39-like [Selaginella moellendorffii]|uniref:coiled-coil domain-containing protein 39-like n=1 Tax=Selaginella moellendorffii TaxID=88036 RepID=UPI000D1D104A|nr:coiled-coil domain-containing protein 39-like [Selaginella moellendorffii]|eukprot:XP_024531274.1 coiled-coil domain-containing protein 39-like [Selaginella moellendorffii]
MTEKEVSVSSPPERAPDVNQGVENDDKEERGGWTMPQQQKTPSKAVGFEAASASGEQPQELKAQMKRRMSKMKKMVSELGLKQESVGGLIDLSFLPGFASDEVKALNKDVLKAEKELRDVEELVEEQEERSSIMEEHMKRVRQEITFTQLRADVKRREAFTEENLRKISEMEARRLEREIRKFEKDTDELNDRMRGLKAAINSGNEKMDEFRLLMQWNQEELDQWMQAARQKDEDSVALQSYTKNDSSKLKELYLELEKASGGLYNLQQQLDDEVTETQSAQIQLNRTAEVFKDLQNERQKLVVMWEETIEAIHMRDEGIHKAAEEFAANKAVLRHKKRQLDGLSTNLDGEVEKNDLVNKRKKLELVERKLADLRIKVEDEYMLLDTLDKKRHELEKILATEEVNLKVARKEVSDLRERHFKESEKLNDMKAKEKDILFEIHGAKSQAKSLTNQIHQLESSMIKQEEVLYSAEFQIQCLERKVARAGGETSDVEAREFNAKIQQLEQELQEKLAEEVIVLQQLKKSQDDLRAAVRKREELTRKLNQIEEKNAELSLESETGLHTLKNLVKEKEEKMLSRDLLQMEVNRLQGMLSKNADAVFGMESTKRRLQMSMEECRREIERSPNYFVIKAAQEREEIQREGYKLEQEVKQVQADVSSLARAFEDVKDANTLYRNSHKTANTLKLENEKAHLKVVFEQAKERLQNKEFDQAEQRNATTEEKESHELETLKILQHQVETAEKDNKEHTKKQRRATVRFERLASKLKESYGDLDAERIAKEMQLSEARETITDVLYKLKAVIQENPDLGRIIQERVADAGFKMPSNTSSVKSNVSGSTRGSIISSRGSIFSAGMPGSARTSRSGSVVTMEFLE